MAVFTLSLILAAQLPSAAAPPQPPPTVSSIRMLDVTGDGRLDRLELRDDGTLQVAVNAGARIFDPIEQVLPSTPIADILVGDLDGDERIDLYLISPQANVALLGDGSGYFRDATIELGLADRGVGVRAERVDLDGDRLDDLLLHNTTRDVIFWGVPGDRFERSADTPEEPAAPTGPGATGGSTDLTGPTAGTGDAPSTPGDPDAGGAGNKGAPPPTGSNSAVIPPGGGPSLGGPTTVDNGLRVDGARGTAGNNGAAPTPILPPHLATILDGLYVNDDAGEVDGADIAGGDLTLNRLYFGTHGARADGNQGGSLELGHTVSAGGETPFIDFHYGAGVEQDYNMRIINNGDAQLSFREDGFGDRMTVKDGDVGIGLTSGISHRLTVTSTDDDTLRLTGPDSFGHGARLNFGDSDFVFLDEDEDDKLEIHASSRTYFSGGKVGINNPTPTGRLDVVSASSGGYSSSAILAENTSTGSGIAIWAETNGTDATLVVDQDGSGPIIRGFQAGSLKFEVRNSGRVVTTALQITGGGDLVEGFDTGGVPCEPGTVVVIDPDESGTLRPSRSAYDRRVAGVVSGAGGIEHGVRMGQDGVLDGDTLVAMAGRVYVSCTTENGPITPGDLLTTSTLPGHAMKATDPGEAFGSVLGKAMTPLDDDTGLVLVLVNLQ